MLTWTCQLRSMKYATNKCHLVNQMEFAIKSNYHQSTPQTQQDQLDSENMWKDSGPTTVANRNQHVTYHMGHTVAILASQNTKHPFMMAGPHHPFKNELMRLTRICFSSRNSTHFESVFFAQQRGACHAALCLSIALEEWLLEQPRRLALAPHPSRHVVKYLSFGNFPITHRIHVWYVGLTIHLL